MIRTKQYVAWLMAALFIGFTAACAPMEERRGTGEVVDDVALTARVKTALVKASQEVDWNAVNVNTFRGEVILSGFVESEAMVRRAGEIARSVQGVRVVRNDLRPTPRR